MLRNAVITPHTVPIRPMNGETLPVVARNPTWRSSRASSSPRALHRARGQLDGLGREVRRLTAGQERGKPLEREAPQQRPRVPEAIRRTSARLAAWPGTRMRNARSAMRTRPSSRNRSTMTAHVAIDSTMRRSRSSLLKVPDCRTRAGTVRSPGHRPAGAPRRRAACGPSSVRSKDASGVPGDPYSRRTRSGGLGRNRSTRVARPPTQGRTRTAISARARPSGRLAPAGSRRRTSRLAASPPGRASSSRFARRLVGVLLLHGEDPLEHPPGGESGRRR